MLSRRFPGLRRSPPARFLREARADDLGVHLLAASAQQLLCTAPLAVALAAVSTRTIGVPMGDLLTRLLGLDAGAQHAVQVASAGSARVSSTALWVNLVIAVTFGVGLAGTVQRALEIIWRRSRGPTVRSVPRQAGWAVALPVMICAVIVIGRTSRAGSPDTPVLVVLGFAAQLAVIGAFSWWTQWLLLGGREPWRRLWPSALLFVTGLLVVWLAARVLIAGQLVSAYRAYGPLGVGIVLSAWTAVASSVTTGALVVGCRWRRALSAEETV